MLRCQSSRRVDRARRTETIHLNHVTSTAVYNAAVFDFQSKRTFSELSQSDFYIQLYSL